jgi:hypothetical protein
MLRRLEALLALLAFSEEGHVIIMKLPCMEITFLLLTQAWVRSGDYY